MLVEDRLKGLSLRMIPAIVLFNWGRIMDPLYGAIDGAIRAMLMRDNRSHIHK